MKDFDILILLSTILPILLGGGYIYYRDKFKKEPLPILILAMFLGVAAATVTIALDWPELRAFRQPSVVSWWDSLGIAFRRYAIPSELAKFVVLIPLLWLNKYYDEYVDAIVYSVCVALGFIALKNGWFLYFNPDGQVSRGFLTALVLIPAHFTIGVAMGYFFGLARLLHRPLYYLWALVSAIFIDGLFCSLFIWIDDQYTFDIVAVAALVLLGLLMHFISHHITINHLLEEDRTKQS